MDTSNIGKEGVQRNKNVGPNPKHTSFNNFENFNAKGAKQPRGHRPVDPRGVRGNTK